MTRDPTLIPGDGGNGLDLNREVTGQLADFHGCASRLWVGQHLSVDLIHGSVVRHVGQVDSRLEHVVPRGVGLLQDRGNAVDD